MCWNHVNQFDVVRNPQVIMGEHEHEEQVQLFHVDVVRPIKAYVTKQKAAEYQSYWKVLSEVTCEMRLLTVDLLLVLQSSH